MVLLKHYFYDLLQVTVGRDIQVESGKLMHFQNTMLTHVLEI